MSSTSDEPKLCVKCRFIGTNGSGAWKIFKCFAPANKTEVNLVTGGQDMKHEYCVDARDDPMACGRKGNWWEEQEVRLIYDPAAISAGDILNAPPSSKIPVRSNPAKKIGLQDI